MDNSQLIDKIVNEVLKNITLPKKDLLDNQCELKEKCKKNKTLEKLTKKDYPLSQKRNELIKTKSGKSLEDINIENVLNETIGSEDIKITSEVLLYQAQIAESIGRYQFAKNLKRAAELTVVPDDRVLEIYNALRPYRSTKQELLDIAYELENKYNAKINASLVREACEIYENRGRLKV